VRASGGLLLEHQSLARSLAGRDLGSKHKRSLTMVEKLNQFSEQDFLKKILRVSASKAYGKALLATRPFLSSADVRLCLRPSLRSDACSRWIGVVGGRKKSLPFFIAIRRRVGVRALMASAVWR
jgi:hypothetical protein